MARSQHVASDRRPLRPARLLARLSETRRILADARERLTSLPADEQDTSSAAEWLLDNYYVVQDQLEEVRQSLPGGYYRELPELLSGPLTGYPRVYELATSLISHTEGRIDVANVDLYVASVQSVSPLSLGELWAIPAMLRIGLIESVRRLTLRSMERLDERAQAARWATRILDAGTASGRAGGNLGGSALRVVMQEFAGENLAQRSFFVTRLMQLLRQVEGTSPTLAWIENWLVEGGQASEDAVAAATRRLALTQLMMANSITSLRSVGQRDWRDFVEHQSVVEAELRDDPSGCYATMTFKTRDSYRHEVERLAKKTGHRERSVARWAVDLARRHVTSDTAESAIRSHVGYYLVDKGITELEALAGYRPALVERLARYGTERPNLVLVGGVTLCMIGAIVTVIVLGQPVVERAVWLAIAFAFLPALDIAINVFNHLVTMFIPPRTLPRLELTESGIPERLRTAVVVPTLFGDVGDVREALEHLEVQFLANREPHLHFALLSDFTDAVTESTGDDDEVIRAALDGVAALNALHAADAPPVFFVLHRPRRWNPAQGVWMGWERKRGKLSEFNRWVRAQAPEAFTVVSEDAEALRGVRYVITLDADTVLPPEAASLLVGTMAHPLNQPVFEEEGSHMVRGYGILQPRVGVTLPSAHQSRFASIASGHPGVDPYTVAASDVYQDLYGEGSFTGKGIYDVDAFERATHGRFPENVLLSHDLLEGNYARAGLATDVIVYDEYPSDYRGFSRRKHRWIRGDWQLLPWLRRTVPGPDGRERNRLSLVSRWKIVDNLRRSTVEITQLLFLLWGWTAAPFSPVRWTLLGLGAIVAPWVIALLRAVVTPPLDKSFRAYYSEVAQDAFVSAQQAVLAILVLPHQALLSIDAIVRTLYRLIISRRHLLDWQAASFVARAASEQASRTGIPTLRTASLLVLGVGVGISLLQGRALLAAGLPPSELVAPALSLWLLVGLWLWAPTVVRQLNDAAVPAPPPLSATARATAMRYAAHHWQFFDRFVTESTHWLAPDNFQDEPAPVVAMRTSPTNIGLQLLSTVSAADLKLISAADMTDRLERVITTLAILPRYRGHFYNWYDLTDLRVLDPPYVSTVDSGNLAGHLIALRQACLEHATAHPALSTRLHDIAEHAYRFVAEMEFGFLYDDAHKLFSIGFHTESFTCDASYYDLLASEARLASFIAIARRDVPMEHWFRMSRTLNRSSGAVALVSWSGSMFEYLMPLLVMRSLPYTLLAQTCRGAVERQRQYARIRGVPWGISESAYNVRDREDTYQYRAFGVADLALKRGMGRDLVVAPYASALALAVDPVRALANLQVLEGLGALGEFGFMDALDYTRPEAGARFALVHTWMSHHIGMSMVALTNVLRDDCWQTRFHADTLVKSVELLLHERVPRRFVTPPPQRARPDEARPATEGASPVSRQVAAHEVASPRIALLGSEPYTVVLNHSGSGYSRYAGLAVTRWRGDGTRDATGQFCYIKDVEDGSMWSAFHQPLCVPADHSHVSLAADRVTMHRRDGTMETTTAVTVVAGDSAEVRTVTLTNTGRRPRDLELTSFGELVMAPHDADRAHPAFSNLFVETEFHAWCTAITATRRPRTPSDPRLWCVHVVDAGADQLGSVTCETDRAQFIGRGRTVRNPEAMEHDGALSGTVGAVLDPIVSLRTRVRVPPSRSVSVTFTTLVAKSREEAFTLADRYHDSHAGQRALDLAWSSTQIELQEFDLTSAQSAAFQDIATQLLYRGGSLAPPPDELRRNEGVQSMLWANGISGDQPIVLATINSLAGIPTLLELFHAHRFWRRRGLGIDLVVINGNGHDYLQELHDRIMQSMVSANDAALLDRAGGVFVRRRDAFQPADYLMLSATARIQIACDGRTLANVLSGAESRALAQQEASARERRAHDHTPPSLVTIADPRERDLAGLPTAERSGPFSAIVSALRPNVQPARTPQSPPAATPGHVDTSLAFHNGIGGLDASGDYRMQIAPDHLPPAPWANVIANARGGFLVSERGAGCTWAGNAYFYRLSPWHNDPVSDPACDVVYIKDEESREIWSATPAPVPSAASYRVRHGKGESTFATSHTGIESELQLGMPRDAAVKTSVLRLTNTSDRQRRLSVTAYVEWTLGVRRDETQYQVRTEFNGDARALLARNHFDPVFADWTAFLAVSEPVLAFTADRLTFLGRNGRLDAPRALTGGTLDGAAGVGLDPCAALQMQVDLAPGETREITVLLGAAPSADEALTTLYDLRAPGRGAQVVQDATDGWRDRLRVIQVSTPDAAFDAMLNGWALYQALSCRFWARMGLYQSSGAYGFRDQLQDVMAFVYAEPALARAHILRASRRQFLEGDVQHWWHPDTGRGVRTRFSDDLVWLPYVVEQYVRVTGDASVLDEYTSFLDMRQLAEHEHELYDLPTVTDEHGSVYEHCRRALHRACTHGVHGLPLMGIGDWNDGMSRVGVDGQGESVWLAWFLIATLRSFAPLAEARGDASEGAFMREQADAYQAAVEQHGWDGAWYRRAYYDDGTPLGSAASDECRIDAIAQSWSVISGAGQPARQQAAMEALDAQLVREDARLIMLLTPPFDQGAHDPGYIKGYVPGVRENGAQYTHAALWVVMATAMQGRHDRAFALFRLLNPLTHADSAEGVQRYKVEPYVVAADVYTNPLHIGRGGWTWYTGSASWMYRVGLEQLLGFTKVGGTLRIVPCVPEEWPSFTITYRFGDTPYTIVVNEPAAVAALGGRMTVDGVVQPEAVLQLDDDGAAHTVLLEPLRP